MIHQCSKCFKSWEDGGILNEYILFLLRRSNDYCIIEGSLRHICGNCFDL